MRGKLLPRQGHSRLRGRKQGDFRDADQPRGGVFIQGQPHHHRGAAADHFQPGLRQRLAMLGSDGQGDLLLPLAHQRGGAQDDYLQGGEGNDFVDGGYGNDEIYGNDNNDTLRGYRGEDYLSGGDGRDKLWVDETWVYDGSGWWWNPNNWDRRIVASGRIDGTWFSEVVDPASVASLNIFTLGGNDRVVVSHDAGLPVMVDAGAGNDFVWICSGNASVHAGAGNDVVWTGAGNDFVDGGAGNDEIWTDGGRDTIVDMNGNNSVVSGGGADTITTGAGDDLIWSEGGSDIIDAGDGNNFVNSGGGADRVTTGSGDDWVELGGGDDVAILGSGNDTALGGVGNDALIGEAGDDDLRGGRGNDLLIGGIGSDQLRGGKDDDLLIAGSTIFDSDATAIDAIMSEWSRDAAYAARIMNLRNGTGSHLNGVALVAGATVIEDDDDDVLRGQHGQDWFFASQTNDQIRGREDDEEVDWWNI